VIDWIRGELMVMAIRLLKLLFFDRYSWCRKWVLTTFFVWENGSSSYSWNNWLHKHPVAEDLIEIHCLIFTPTSKPTCVWISVTLSKKPVWMIDESCFRNTCDTVDIISDKYVLEVSIPESLRHWLTGVISSQRVCQIVSTSSLMR